MDFGHSTCFRVTDDRPHADLNQCICAPNLYPCPCVGWSSTGFDEHAPIDQDRRHNVDPTCRRAPSATADWAFLSLSLKKGGLFYQIYVLNYIEENVGASGKDAAATLANAEIWEEAVARFDAVWTSSLSFAIIGSILYFPDLWSYCKSDAAVTCSFTIA